jgi:hypothetical protein
MLHVFFYIYINNNKFNLHMFCLILNIKWSKKKISLGLYCVEPRGEAILSQTHPWVVKGATNCVIVKG